jgi:membrane dipeptidase
MTPAMTPATTPAMTPATMARWRAERPWLDATIVCDGLLPWTDNFLPPGANLAEQLRRFHANGVDHISLTAAGGSDSARAALGRLGWLRRELATHGDWVSIARDDEAIKTAKAARRLSVTFHFQTATPFSGNLDLVNAFFGAQVRRAILAYNEANVFADGCHEPRNGGLSALGRGLIERMDQVGMIVDMSHCSERTTFDAMAAPLARAPIFSHSNARAIYDHERNISDDQIRACAKRGGYIGINGVGFFLGAEGSSIAVAMAEHAAHIAGLAGAERVGLGLDFMYLAGSDYEFFRRARGQWPRGYPHPPWSFLQPEQIGDLVQALEKKGFDRDEMKGLLGGNYLRLAN